MRQEVLQPTDENKNEVDETGNIRLIPLRYVNHSLDTRPDSSVTEGSNFSNPYHGLSAPYNTSSSVMTLSCFSCAVISRTVLPVRYHK